MSFAHLVNYSSQAELDAARAATQDKYKKIFSRQIEEGRRQGKTPLESMDFSIWHSRVATPEENQEYRWAFTPLGTQVRPWKKWGGGNKMGSAGASITAARKARAAARRNAPDANVNNYTNKNLADRLGLTALSNFVDSRFNDTQGKNLPSNPSFGFSQKTLNAADARGADPSFAGDIGASVYGGDMTGSTPSIGSYGDVSSFGNFLGGLPSLDAGSVVGDFGYSPTFNVTAGLGDPSLSSFSSFSPDSFLGNMAAIGVGYPHTNVREYDGKFLPYMGGGRPGNVRPKGPAAFPSAFNPRMAGIFGV